jgi:RNA polymerase sigma-54 factor
MKLNQRMSMHMKLSPQLVVTSKLLRASQSDLDHILAQEVAANPALEGKQELPGTQIQAIPESYAESLRATQFSPSWRSAHRPSDAPNDDLIERLPAHPTPFEILASQVKLIAGGDQRSTALILLHCLDQRGYLNASPEKLAEELGISLPMIQAGILTLHELEPPGIGACDLQQCLLLQCQYIIDSEAPPDASCVDTRLIIESAWEDFLHQRWARVKKKTGLSHAAIQATVGFMRKNLYPYPIALLGSCADPSGAGQVFHLPDIIFRQVASSAKVAFRLEIPGEERYQLRVAERYSNWLDNSATLSMTDRAWIRFQITRGCQVVHALEQRWDTLRRLGQYLIEHQADFLAHGPLYLQPLTRQQVAQALGVHESTICRAVLDKIAQLPDGRLVPLCNFFDSSLPVKEHILQVLAKESRPLNDREISERLCAMGMPIARRTVAKYRLNMKQEDKNDRRPQTVSITTSSSARSIS